MTALDVGCAMGFFSLPLARIVGPSGKVICIDLQEKMLESLEKRAARAGLAGRVDARRCPKDSLAVDDLAGQIDFVLAFAVAHEVPDSTRMLRDIYASLKSGGRLLLAEPKGHVSAAEFDALISAAEQTGFSKVEYPRISRSRAAVLEKQSR